MSDSDQSVVSDEPRSGTRGPNGSGPAHPREGNESGTETTDPGPVDSPGDDENAAPAVETMGRDTVDEEHQDRDDEGTAPAHFTLELDVTKRVTYAMAFNRRPIIRTATIRNIGGAEGEQVTLRVTSRWSVSERPPVGEYTVTFDCPPLGGTVEIDLSGCRLDDTVMVDVTEASPAVIEATVVPPSGPMATSTVDIDILARNQWSWEPASLTAAFVQPNHPTTKDITNDASAILQKRTGRSSLEGYQSGPKRADEIAKAVFEALKGRIPNYINPPAGYEKEGQKLRPLDQVLDERQGTCFDLACAYASCLEQVGLFPLVFLVHGHAFAGYFRKEGELKSTVESSHAALLNLLDAGDILAVDAVGIPGDGTFEESVASVRKHFGERSPSCPECVYRAKNGDPAGKRPHFEAAIDIARAHREGIRPIPARVVQDGVITLVIDNGPTAPPVIERRDAVTRKLLPRTVPLRVQQWKNSLLDLTLRPQGLLNIDPSKKSGPLELLPAPGSLGAIEDRLAAGQTIEIAGVERLTDLFDAFDRRLMAESAKEQLETFWRSGLLLTAAGRDEADLKAKGLASRARKDLQDIGVNNLNLGIGLVRGLTAPEDREPSDSTRSGPIKAPPSLSAPVFFVPLKLEYKRGRGSFVIRMDETGMTTPNYSLLEYLRAKKGLELEWFKDDMRDDSGLDVETGLQRIRDELIEKGQAGSFLVDESAVIGMFSYRKLRLWRDLEDHWQDFAENPVVKHLIDGGTTSFRDPANPDGEGPPPFDDTTLQSPQPADGAQTRAIVRALAGHSFVLEGPPGTGKSQTITNLLANALAEGRRVLFVAEKSEARTVVRDRLRAVGLDPFCLDLHAKGSKPDQIKEQLREAMDFVPAADMAAWADLEQEFGVAAAALARYRQRLHAATPPSERSFVDDHLARRELGDGPTAAFGRAATEVDHGDIEELRVLLTALAGDDVRAARPSRHHAWRFATVTGPEQVDRPSLAAAVRAIAGGIPAVRAETGAWRDAVEAAPDPLGLSAVAAAMRLARSGGVPSGSEWRELARDGRADAVRAAADRMRAAASTLRELDPRGPVELLGRDLDPVLAAVRTAAASFVLGRRGRITGALGDLASLACFAGKVDPLPALERLVAAARDHRTGDAELRATPGLSTRLPAGILVDDALEAAERDAMDLITAAAGVTTGTAAADALLGALAGVAVPAEQTVAALSGVVSALDEVMALTRADVDALRAWTEGRTVLAAIEAALPDWDRDAEGSAGFLRLGRWAGLLARIEPLAGEPFEAFRRQLLNAEIGLEDARDAFDRSLLDAMLTVVAEKHDFDVFDWMAHDGIVDRFTELVGVRQRMLRSVIPHELHARRTFDATSSVGTVGALRTELNSKRRGAKSVRDLINRYPDLIMQLTPCFLMSPESVAQFLTPGLVEFDIVVFDEASQIPVADAIGAMGRAKSVIIVGDSRQMPPTTGFGLGGTSTGEDDLAPERLGTEELVPEDAESILEECVESGLTSELLTWHYRSRDEALIAFSNQHYYEGRLASFPGPMPRRPDLGIEYHRIDGQFIHGKQGTTNIAAHQTNPIEADAIVAEVRRRVHDPELSQFSLGVVTLNLKQRKLVEEKLKDLRDERIAELMDTDDDERRLIVRNLEEVQGQERDVIILGTSFSRLEGGGPMPLRFGPLNLPRGERRLNVAVTRARRQVVIFSSFDPEELSRATAVGLQHLRTYLEQARAMSQPESDDDAGSATIDHMTREVAEALRERGLVVKEAHGLSTFKVDLAVTTPEHPDRWLMGLLLDGREWGSRPLALDRDALPMTVLHGMMGWPVVARVWLPGWMNAQEEILESLVDRVRIVARDPDAATAAPSVPDQKADPVRPTVAAGTSAGAADGPSRPDMASRDEAADDEPPRPAPQSRNVRPYVVWEHRGRIGAPEDLDRDPRLATARLRELAAVEGPVLVEDALRSVVRTFGLGRLRQSRIDQLLRHVPRELTVRTPFGTHLFPEDLLLGPGEVAADFDWYRPTSNAERSIEVISPHELANAAAETARMAHGIDAEELAAEMLRRFGYARRTADKFAHALSVVEWAVTAGRLRTVSGVVHPAD